VVQIRPQAERKLRTGFQRHVDEQSDRYAAELTHAEQLAAWFECGEVIGVFGMQAGGAVKRSAYVVALLPIAAIPGLIAGAAAGIPGALPVLGALPFVAGAWFGLSMWRGREPRRRAWCYAFAEGFMLLDDPQADAVAVRWSEVTEVGEVWTDVFDVSAEDSRRALTAYRLRCADGQAHEISRSFRNVRDPYPDVGQLLRSMMPASVGTTMPTFPTIDEIVVAFAGRQGPRAC